jgi:hypothetical protein
MSNLEIPSDFPVEKIVASVSGVQAKIPLVEEGGQYYAHGTSPSEVAAVYALCEDLSKQLTAYCERKFAEGIGSKERVLARAHTGLVGKKWCTPRQAIWTVRRTAKLLDWDLPKSFPTL